MLRNNQKSITRLIGHFEGMFQRNFASNIRRSSKSMTSKNNIHAVSPPESANGLEVPQEEPVNAHYLKCQIGSTHRRWNAVLEKHPELKTVKRQDAVNTANALKRLNFDVETILTKPLMLYQNALTVENRYQVLHECGFKPITLVLLSKYITVLNKTVSMLKSHGYIPFEANVLENLCNSFNDLELPAERFKDLNEAIHLKYLRECILNAYLRQRLDMNDNDIKKLWQVYHRVRHRSFKSVQSVVQVLLEDLRFPKERIIKNAYLLYGDADNIRRIIKEIVSIDGQDMRDIVYRRPKILMSSCDGLLKTLEHVKAYGISESAVIKCLEILTLGSDTVLERLKDLHTIEEFKVLGTNPRVLRLVHYQNKARLRLEYLNQLKVRCASLHILSGGSEKFAKFAREGTDRTKGRDVVVYLANILKKDENDVRTLLGRHPNWCHIPVLQLKQCFDFLQSKKFPISAIYDNIHVLLYPIQRIEEKLMQLQNPEVLEELQLPVNSIFYLDNHEMLTLIIYLIECEFHFTGDGIWTEQQTQPVENFNNLLPDFPEGLNKVYKYGIKPAESSSSTVQRSDSVTVQN
ncbi:transcription termination factor 5, mitochondrial-like [Rhagoletis pomonella]|uniref:transcription termination factor 5, mitochondrial-like n=1 Tax=Rhagoletis pomonella TaxID=28610 RepID=UPI00177B8D42|nr:transcription termination factor 5, mitochondrial-like [Rhagoletis pomonella]XP_036342716.1 transcription termination factor 5, mitochondrial-like [Rhagoletis pomonella]